MTMHTQAKLPTTFRTRDILAILALLLVGLSLMYTALVRGASPSGSLTLAAFAVSVGLLALGYGFGWMVDKITDRYPALAKQRFSPISFFILAPIIGVGLFILWDTRASLVGQMQHHADEAVTSVQETVKRFTMVQ